MKSLFFVHLEHLIGKKRGAPFTMALQKFISFKGGLEKAINDYSYIITIEYE